MSLRTRFILIIGILSLLAIVGNGIASYKFSVNNAIFEAKAKGQIVFDFLNANREHFRDKQKPKIMKLLDTSASMKSPELISGFAVTRGVWDEFQKDNSNYHFKQATIDPLHLSNKADDTDMQIIDKFKASPDKKNLEGTISRADTSYYYYAQQIPVLKQCLRCHGDPQKAPKWQTTRYGTKNGYNWKKGDIISAYVVYIPLYQAIDLAKRNALYLVGISTGIVLVLMLVIWFFTNVSFVKPLSELERRSSEISLGKNLADPIAINTSGEIESLAHAVDRLRISVKKMLSREHSKK